MKVSELGEFGLIDLLTKMVLSSQSKQSAPYQQLILGIGDDTAAWYGAVGTQLVTTDSLFQDIHFTLKTTPWQELGWKALAVNVSDIAAMGGVPQYALISLALPEDTEVDEKFTELKQYRKNIGRTGMLALTPYLQTSSRDLWQIYLLHRR